MCFAYDILGNDDEIGLKIQTLTSIAKRESNGLIHNGCNAIGIISKVSHLFHSIVSLVSLHLGMYERD